MEIDKKQHSLVLNGKPYSLAVPVVMGIVNATPDSFYGGNRFTTDKEILLAAETKINDGAFILDIGGYSTRPNAPYVTEDEELRRVGHAIELIVKSFPDAILSVDTFRSQVARHCVENYGVAMINDIGGGTLDEHMFDTIVQLQVAYVLMHTRGNPANMQQMTNYNDFVSEVYSFLEQQVKIFQGMGGSNIVVDPGFGFAKTVEQNYQLLKHIDSFQQLQLPVLAGLSRKSMLYKLLDTSPATSLNATTAANMLALMGGASILRVHDVKEAVEAIRIFEAYRK
jgi:dihydropteroate synthase